MQTASLNFTQPGPQTSPRFLQKSPLRPPATPCDNAHCNCLMACLCPSWNVLCSRPGPAQCLQHPQHGMAGRTLGSSSVTSEDPALQKLIRLPGRRLQAWVHQTHGFPSPAAELGQREVSPGLLPEFTLCTSRVWSAISQTCCTALTGGS